MKSVEVSAGRALTSTFDKGQLYAPSVNINTAAFVFHLQQYAQKNKGTGGAFAPWLLLYLLLSVQRINRNNQGEAIGYKCSYAEIARYYGVSATTAVRAAKWLEQKEWLTITKDGKTSVFNLNVERINDCLANPSAAACAYDNGDMWAALLQKRTHS